MRAYRIDPDMIGTEFNGDVYDLNEFADILAECSDLLRDEIEPVENAGDFNFRPDVVDPPLECDWLRALTKFVDTRPELFY